MKEESFEEENGVETNTFQVTVSHIMLSAQSSAAQFIVFREKRKMARREISREKLLAKKRSRKISKKQPKLASI